MPEVNRYSPMIQPLIVNPVGFEEFARLPMARAETASAATAAMESIKTQFNVGDADLAKVNEMVSAVDAKKENIVNNIATTGVSNNVVSEIIKLKRERDDLYKNKIRQAEENKLLQHEFENSIRKLYATVNPEYGELIIERNKKGWQGTFTGDKKAPTRMFEGNMGAKYFDRYQDIYLRIAEAAKYTDLETKPTGGGDPYFKEEVTALETMVAQITPGRGSKTAETNKKQVEAAKENIIAQYMDPTTERGRFIQYLAENDPEREKELLNEIKRYAEESVKEVLIDRKIHTETSPRSKQFTNKGNQNQGINPDYDFTGVIETETGLNPDLDAFRSGTFTNLGKRVEKGQKSFDVVKEEKGKSYYFNPMEQFEAGFKGIKAFFSDPNAGIDTENMSLDAKDKLIHYNFHDTFTELIKENANKPNSDFNKWMDLAYKSKNVNDQHKFRNKILETIADRVAEKHKGMKYEEGFLWTESFSGEKGGYNLKDKASMDKVIDNLARSDEELVEYTTGKFLKDDEKEVVKKARLNGNVLPVGFIPKYSQILLRDGQYLEGYAGGLVFKVNAPESAKGDMKDIDQKQYIQPRKQSDRDTFEGRVMEAKHKVVMNLKPGEISQGDLVYRDPITNKLYPAVIRRKDGVSWGFELQVLGTGDKRLEGKVFNLLETNLEEDIYPVKY